MEERIDEYEIIEVSAEEVEAINGLNIRKINDIAKTNLAEAIELYYERERIIEGGRKCLR